MVNRFDLVSGYMQKWPEGNWVEYEDYERLKQEFMDYVVIKEKQIAHLEAMLGVADDNR